jgi:hypothetical protein
MEEKIIKITVKKDGADKSIKDVDKGLKSTDKGAANTGATLDKLSGGAITAFKSMKAGLMSVVSGFKSLKFAIAATGIGLLIVGIAAVSAAFKGSEEGQNKFAKLMAVIGAVTGNLVDVLADLGDFIINLFSGNGKAMMQLKSFGESIFDVLGLPIKTVIDTVKALGKVMGALFSGDISGAFDELSAGIKDIKGNFTEAKNAVTGVSDALVDFGKQNVKEAKAAAQVADDRAKADKIERDLIVDKAQAENDIAKLRLIAKQQNKFSAKERQTALIEAGKIQDGLIAREKEVLVLRANAIALENTFARSNKENLTSEAQAAAAVIRAETSRVNFKRQLARELTAAENEQETLRIAKIKEKEKVLADAEKIRIERVKLEEKTEGSRLQKIADIQDEFKKKREEALAITEIEKLELDKERKLQELIDLDASEKAKADIVAFYDNKINKKREEDKKKEFNINKEVENAKVNLKENTLNLIGNIAERGSAIAKALAIREIVIEQQKSIAATISATTIANAKAVAASPLTAGQPFVAINTVSAGVGIAAGLAQAAKSIGNITSNSNSPSGGGGSRRGGASGGASAPSFNLVQGTDSNQIAQSINQGNQTPTQAFVVGSAVTTQQELDRNKISIGSI